MMDLATRALVSGPLAWVAAADVSTLERVREFVFAEYEFALLCAIGSALVGICCGILGSFLVLRRMSLIGDVLGHAMLPGVVLGFMAVGSKVLLPLYLGALTTGLLAAFSFGFIVRNSRTKPDAALGLVLTGFFGLGIVLLTAVQNSPSGNQAGLSGFLFGNAIAITRPEVQLLGALAILSIVAIGAAFRPLTLLSFDVGFARSVGVRTGALHYALMGLTSLVIVASIQSVGVVLVVAMLITPASAAYLLVDRMVPMVVLSAVIGGASGYLGTLISYVYSGWSSGPTMVLVASGFFVLATVFAPSRGLLVTWLRRQRRRRRPARSDGQSQHPTHTDREKPAMHAQAGAKS